MINTREEFYKLGLDKTTGYSYSIVMYRMVRDLKLDPLTVYEKGKARPIVIYYMPEEEWKTVLAKIKHKYKEASHE